MSLISEVSEEADQGYIPDSIVIDRLEIDGRRLRTEIWQAVLDEVLLEEKEGREAARVVDDLAALGAAALERGNARFGENVLDRAQQTATDTQRERILELKITRSSLGSPQALVSSRAIDSVRQRVTRVQPLIVSPGGPSPNAPVALRRRLVAWVYSRSVARAIARILVLVLADATGIALGVLVGLAVRGWVEGTSTSAIAREFVRVVGFWDAVGIFLFGLLGLYKADSPRARLAPILLAALVLGGIALVTGSADDPRFADAIAALLGASSASFVCYRLRVRYDRVSRNWVRRHGFEACTLLVGDSNQVTNAKEALVTVSRPTRVVGYLTAVGDPHREEGWLGTVEDLSAVIRQHQVGRVVIADRDMAPAARQALADQCHRNEVRVEVVPSLADLRAGCGEFIAGQSIVLMRLDPLWPSNARFFGKRAFDLFVAIFGIVILAPIWMSIAIAVRIQGGPVLVRSRRPGIGGLPFEMIRFRTNPGSSAPAASGVRHGREDMRGLSGFLHMRGLDELPQLLNVLLGDMSIVGPRPLQWADHAVLTEEERLRYVVKPGMTGPWLVAAQTRLSAADLTSLDFAYLSTRAITTDLEILVKTLGLVVWGRSELPEVTGP
jgi:lipopolysaccharide/colanic/teichoic acid biosynthesis glycosyltransferase